VFGHSGAGKTYLLSTLALGALGSGVQVYVIDPEHEYGALAKEVGGVDIQLALGAKHSINVLELRPGQAADETWLGSVVAETIDLCAVICGGLDETERAQVDIATRKTLLSRQGPLLGDVAEALPQRSRVAKVLTRWVQGSLGQMFSSPTNVDLDAPIVVFGMRELRDEMVAPVHFLLAEALWRRIKRRDQRRLLIVDELGLLFEDPTIRRFVVGLARRIRKYNGALLFATQNPGDLLASEAGAVVATNPATVLIGAQRPGEAAKLQHVFDLSDHQRIFLEVAARGEFLLCAGPDRLELAVQAPPWQEALMRRSRPPPTSGRLVAACDGYSTTACTAFRSIAWSVCTSSSRRSPKPGLGAASSRGSRARNRAAFSRWSTSATSRTTSRVISAPAASSRWPATKPMP
jgi:type IV secretory pathway VirB4 component